MTIIRQSIPAHLPVDEFGKAIPVPSHRVFLQALGVGWGEVFELELFDRDEWFDQPFACPATAAPLTPRVTFAAGTTINAASIDSRGRRMVALDSTGALHYANISVGRPVGETYETVNLKVTPCDSPVDVISTDAGVIIRQPWGLCGVKLPLDYGGWPIDEVLFQAVDVPPCDSNCPPMVLSPNEAEIWLGGFNSFSPSFPNEIGELRRYSAINGVLLDVVTSQERAITHYAYSPDGGTLNVVSAPTGNFSLFWDGFPDPHDVNTQRGADLCAIH